MLHAEAKIRICAAEPVFGPGVVQLLLNVEKYGSLKEACARMGMSYSKGWKIVNRAEKELGIRLIERRHGGKSGGSCTVTGQGDKMLVKYDKMVREIEAYTEKAFETYFPEYGEGDRKENLQAETL